MQSYNKLFIKQLFFNTENGDEVRTKLFPDNDNKLLNDQILCIVLMVRKTDNASLTLWMLSTMMLRRPFFWLR